MYRVPSSKRKTFVTRGINNAIVKEYNDPEYTKYFHDKLEFNKKFNKFLNRDWMEVTEDNYDKFKEFTKKHKEIVIKPVDESCGKGIEIVSINDNNVKKTYNNILKTKRILVEEVAKQCKEVASLHPESINTLRMVTLNQQLVACFIRIGTGKNVVDNFNHGGITAPVNIDTGIIDYPAINKKSEIFERHPDTDVSVIWFQIPKWNKIKRFVTECSKVIPEMGYVGWDVCVGEDGPFLIEGNEFPGHDIYQLPPHRTNDIGMLPILQKAMNRKEDNNEDSDSN
jgi:glutathione synthase/RimK-type ligase-like ATP-grasp enzyme